MKEPLLSILLTCLNIVSVICQGFVQHSHNSEINHMFGIADPADPVDPVEPGSYVPHMPGHVINSDGYLVPQHQVVTNPQYRPPMATGGAANMAMMNPVMQRPQFMSPSFPQRAMPPMVNPNAMNRRLPINMNHAMGHPPSLPMNQFQGPPMNPPQMVNGPIGQSPPMMPPQSSNKSPDTKSSPGANQSPAIVPPQMGPGANQSPAVIPPQMGNAPPNAQNSVQMNNPGPGMNPQHFRPNYPLRYGMMRPPNPWNSYPNYGPNPNYMQMGYRHPNMAMNGLPQPNPSFAAPNPYYGQNSYFAPGNPRTYGVNIPAASMAASNPNYDSKTASSPQPRSPSEFNGNPLLFGAVSSTTFGASKPPGYSANNPFRFGDRRSGNYAIPSPPLRRTLGA